MKDRKLALRYSKALISTLPDPKVAESADVFLMSLGNAMSENADFRAAMLDPAFPRAKRTELLTQIAEASNQPKQIVNFLRALIENNRAASIPSVAEVFHEQREAAAGIVPAVIQSAVPLSEDLKTQARAAMEKMTGRRIQLSCEVEPDLLGGAVTRVGSTVYDGSLRTQLARLRRAMSQE